AAVLVLSQPPVLASRDPVGNATLIGSATPIGGDAVIGLAAGVPNGRFVLAGDFSPGPPSTPFGTLCLGLTRQLTMIVDSIAGAGPRLDMTGSYKLVAHIPSNPRLLGLPYYLQAFVRDPSAPRGLAHSNGLTLLIGSHGGSERLPGGLAVATVGATLNALP